MQGTKKLKNTVLLLFSLVFYAWGEPRLVFLMLITVFCGYILGILTEKYEKEFGEEYKKLNKKHIIPFIW